MSTTATQQRHQTGIQWTHVPGYIGATWNPTTGCTRVSPGCDSCYAFTLHDQRYKANRDAARHRGIGATPTETEAQVARLIGVVLPCPPQYDVPFSTVQLLDERRLTEPLRARKPRAYFVDSMADLFHEDVPDEFIDRVFGVMALSPQHIFMVLTKRPERMREYICAAELDVGTARKATRADKVLWAGQDSEISRAAGRWLAGMAYFGDPDQVEMKWPLPNVWLGVSVEDQERADERIPLLINTPAAVRFLSCEPLLGPVEFSDVTGRSDAIEQWGKRALTGIDWVIVGGESGPRSRPFDLAWARSLRDQCAAADVAFFVKQLGSRPVLGEHRHHDRAIELIGEQPKLRHNHGGKPDEWPEDLRIRQWPEVR